MQRLLNILKLKAARVSEGSGAGIRFLSYCEEEEELGLFLCFQRLQAEVMARFGFCLSKYIPIACWKWK